MHTRFSRHTINNIKRVVVVQCTDTANTNRCRTTRVTIRRNIHTRHTTLQRLHRVVLILLGKLIYTHDRNGSRQISLTLSRITGHDHLLQLLGILFQFYIKRFLTSDSDLLCGIANIRDLKRSLRSHRQAKISIKIGNGSICGSFFQNSRANYGHSRVIRNNTTYHLFPISLSMSRSLALLLRDNNRF